MTNDRKAILKAVSEALKEDIGRGDVTTSALIPGSLNITAEIVVRQKGVICGLSVVETVFKLLDDKAYILKKVNEGNAVNPKDVICAITGNARKILSGERVALNMLGRLSGIATLTNEYVERVRPYPVKIVDTRKTTPGLRVLEKYAVKTGGGYNHRLGLWDQVLIKDNHLVICGAGAGKNVRIGDVIERARKNTKKSIKIEIEIENLHDFKSALDAKPDIIMLDNMPLSDMIKAVSIRNRLSSRNSRVSTRLEASGGVSLSNVRKIASSGVDMISIGALTHSARSLDFSLDVFI